MDRQAGAAVPGQNGKIAFASNRDGNTNYEIYVTQHARRPTGTHELE